MNSDKQSTIKPTRILFVCLGNICRSPAADGIMHHKVFEIGLKDVISIDSAGTYGGHSGELPDARMRQHALKRGYNLTHHSRKVTSSDFDRFDIIVAMDDYNFQDLFRLAPSVDAEKKIFRMTDFLTKISADHVPDPYYDGASGFERVLDILEDACEGLLQSIKQRKL
ncbi:MAG: low molecular weight phosphotyrosine protein phosphatase [Bacteroidales bacterium]|nr:low molecular weight phosphotyrosine protein phosphatase [Bacteroidales bacterium]